MKIKPLLLVIIMATCLSGCFPMRFIEFPGASGRVIDSKTAAPIPNAEVTVSLNQSPEKKTKTVITDSSGVFTIKASKQWGIYILPMDFMSCLGQISVCAKGYKNELKSFQFSPMGPEKTIYGDIMLESK